MSNTPSPAQIADAFASVDRDVPPIDRCERLARAIGTARTLDDAYGLAHNYGQDQLANDLLGYEAALIEAADPEKLIKRLLWEADRADEYADRAWAMEAEHAGKVAHRRQQGQHELADEFEMARTGKQRSAERHDATAFAKRSRAADLRARIEDRKALFEVVAPAPRRLPTGRAIDAYARTASLGELEKIAGVQ